MHFGAAFADIGSIAIKLEPKVLDLGVPKGFKDATVKLVSGGIRCTDMVRKDVRLRAC